MSAALWHEVQALQEQGRDSEALRLCEAVLRHDPNGFDALYLSGFLLLRLRRAQDAATLIERAVIANPASLDAWYHLGVAYLQSERFWDSIKAFDKVLQLHAGVAEAWNNRGIAFLAMGILAEALESFHKAIALGAGTASTYNHRANVFAALKRFPEAAADYEAALAQESDYPYACGNAFFARLQACDWRDLTRLQGELQDALQRGRPVLQPGASLALPLHPQAQLQCARLWAEREVPPQPPFWQGEQIGRAHV